MVSFLKRVQNTPRMRAVKKKIKVKKADLKKLGSAYRRTFKAESKRLGKTITKKKKATKRKTKKKR